MCQRGRAPVRSSRLKKVVLLRQRSYSMDCLGTQTGRREDKKGGKKRRERENKQTNETWGSRDRDAARGQTERAEATRRRRMDRHSEGEDCWGSHELPLTMHVLQHNQWKHTRSHPIRNLRIGAKCGAAAGCDMKIKCVSCRKKKHDVSSV